MVNWRQFDPDQFEFEYDFDRDKLTIHQTTFEEALECFWNDFSVRRNRNYDDRYQLFGRTDGGRPLMLIIQVKSNRVIRIITGWPI